jgi:drug/metabolite transporter (DMT)-like permease
LNFQTAPFFLAFGGVLFFKEKLNALQMACFATLALGMLLFFHPTLNLSNTEANDAWIGVLLVQFSALSWACYALIQKRLIAKLSPGNVLLYIYGSGLLILLPFSDFERFSSMQSPEWVIAMFCAINTLIAYGGFAQAMKYWPTAQVGASVALTPIFSFSLTMLIVSLGWWPEKIVANELTGASLVGIFLVVGSVLIVQLMPMIKQRKDKKLALAS